MFIFEIFGAIITIVAIIAFFYLVDMVSHIRNILRAMYYSHLLETSIEKGEAIPYKTTEKMKMRGVITNEQRQLLDGYSREILKRQGKHLDNENPA